MHWGENKKYVKIASTGITIAAGACVILFTFYRFDQVQQVYHKVFSILRPFLYGAVVAYLLSPLCGKMENGLAKIMGEKRRRGAKQLSILFSLLLALALISLLCLIIIPQVVNSVVSVVNALPGQLRSLNSQIHHRLAFFLPIRKQFQDTFLRI